MSKLVQLHGAHLRNSASSKGRISKRCNRASEIVVNSMEIRSCRDCSNFEERRDIDNAVLCQKNRRPYVCCEDFKPRDESITENRLYQRFCLDCANFEDVNQTPLCAKNRIPGVACEEFTDRYEKLKVFTQIHRRKPPPLAQEATRKGRKSPMHGKIEPPPQTVALVESMLS